MTTKSPGEIIRNDALKHLNIGQAVFANAMGMSRASISRMLTGKSAITPEIALRLETVLNEPAEHWLGLQASYDLSKLRQSQVVDQSGLIRLEERPNVTRAMSLLTEIFHNYRAPTAKIPFALMDEVGKLCSYENLFEMMRRIDPDREVFDFPLSPEERGIHGLLLRDNVFDLCSNYFGMNCGDTEYPIPEEFLAAVEVGFETGALHRRGHLVWNKQENTHGFLVTQVLVVNAVPVEKDIQSLNKRFGDIACYADIGDKNRRQWVYLTAFVRTQERLKDVPKIADALEVTAEKWRKKHLNKQPSLQAHGDDATLFQ